MYNLKDVGLNIYKTGTYNRKLRVFAQVPIVPMICKICTLFTRFRHPAFNLNKNNRSRYNSWDHEGS